MLNEHESHESNECEGKNIRVIRAIRVQIKNKHAQRC